jgi:intracellular sulfur oxidation DsrE/DsrF family protein
MKQDMKGRRRLMSGLGLTAAAVALGSGAARAQAPAIRFQPARHTEDEWMDKTPGKHRVIIDVTSAAGVPDAIRFSGNLYTGNKNGYGVEEAEVAIILCLRHSATAFAYGEAIWAKHGKTLDPTATETPTVNPYDSAPRHDLSGLAKRGVQFIVCGRASSGIARRIAGSGGDSDAILAEMVANMIPSSRLVATGVVGVTHAQEYGYSLLYVG